MAAARQQHRNRKDLAALQIPLASKAEVLNSKRRKYQVESIHFDGPATPIWAQQLDQNLQQQLQELKEQTKEQMHDMKEQMHVMKEQTQQQLQELKETQEQTHLKLQELHEKEEQTHQKLHEKLQEKQEQTHQKLQELKEKQEQTQEQMHDIKEQMQKLRQESQRNMNRSRRLSKDPIEALIRCGDGDSPRNHDEVWFPQDQNKLTEASGRQLNSLLQFYHLPQTGTKTDKQQRLNKFLGINL